MKSKLMRRNILWLMVISVLAVIMSYCSNSKGNESEGQNEKVESKSEYLSLAIEMANSDMKRNPEAWMLDFNTRPRWNYTHGVVCSAIENLWKYTGDKKYYNYLLTYADTMINESGNIISYDRSKFNIDMINTGKFLFSIYNETSTPKFKKAIDMLRGQMKDHPRTSEGGFWHKKRYPHQMWLDGLYMASPFLVQYAVEFGEDSLFDDVINQIHLIEKYTRDEQTGLYFHGWDESREQKWANKETGLSANFWGRGMGWYAMALVDVLDFFPENHPGREDLIKYINHMAVAIVDYQDEKSGVWYQVLDQPDREGNYLESSASSMFVYFLVKGVRKGYLDQKYFDPALKGYEGIIKEFIKVHDDGEVEITNVCGGAGLGGNPYRDGSFEYYIEEEVRSNDPKAVGPFINLCLELEKSKAKQDI